MVQKKRKDVKVDLDQEEDCFTKQEQIDGKVMNVISIFNELIDLCFSKILNKRVLDWLNVARYFLIVCVVGLVLS